MSTVTPPSPDEAQHRLAIAEGLLLSLGSGPRSLEAARKFLGNEDFSIDDAAAGLERVIVEAASTCKQCGGKLDAAGVCSTCKATSATGADIPTTGHDPATEVPYMTMGGLGLVHARAGDEPGDGDLPKDLDKGKRKKRKRKAREDAIAKLLKEDDTTTGATVAALTAPAPTITLPTPPDLRAGSIAESCASCVFFNKGGCTRYANFPVDRSQLCDSYMTVSPPDELGSRSQRYRDRMLTETRVEAVLEEIKSDAYPGLDRSPKENWVDKTGGLPRYIERIAKHVHYEHGKDIGRAIQIAVGVVQRWCKGGGASAHGVKAGSGVSPATKAKACAALAEWDAKRAASKASTAAKKVAESVELVEAHGFWALSVGQAEGLIEAAEWEDARDGGRGFKEPSLAYCERLVGEVEEAYSDWGAWRGGFSPEAMDAIAEGGLELDGATCDIDESLLGRFKAELHPRNRRTGEFADVLGKLRAKRPRTAKLLDQIAGEKKYQVSSVGLDGTPRDEGQPHRVLGRALAHRDRVESDLHGKGYSKRNMHVFVSDDNDPERGSLEWDDARSLEQLFHHDNMRKREQSSGGSTSEDFKVDHAIGEVISKFPNVADWKLEGPNESTAHGKHWVVHVTLADGQQHKIRVGADGTVDYVKPAAAKATKTVEPFLHGNGMQVGEKITFGQKKPAGGLMPMSGLEPTGMKEEPYHMEDGQFFMGTDGVLYQKLEHGSHLLTSKKGSPLAGVRIKNHHTGTEKIAPAFAVKHPYDLYQPKGAGPVKPPPAPKSNDELMGELMSSVTGAGPIDLNGKNVVVTGAIPGMTRTGAHASLAMHGANPQSSVTNTTDYLITGDGVGKVKTDKAAAKGVKVIPYSAIPHLVVEGAFEEATVVLSGVASRLEETLLALAEATDGAAVARLRARRDVLSTQLVRQIEERDFTSARRMALAAEGKALPDGSYPIETKEDLHNAVILANSGHGDVAAAKALIAKRGAELGVKGAI